MDTRYTVVNAALNVLDCLSIGIVFYFELRRSGFDGIETINGLHNQPLRFTGLASGTHHLEQCNIKTKARK